MSHLPCLLFTFLVATFGCFSSPRTALGYLGSKVPMRIDCGSSKVQVVKGIQWQADYYFPEGSTNHTITGAASTKLTAVESTLRAFPVSSSPSCYKVPVPVGRYIVRLGFVYQNYDKLNLPPLFQVILQGITVETVDMVLVEKRLSGTYYTDYLAFAPEGLISACLNSSFSQPAVLNSLAILPSDTNAYAVPGYQVQDVLLNTVRRLNLGGGAVGPEPEDPGFRTWEADPIPSFPKVVTDAKIDGTGVESYFLPENVFRSAQAPPSAINLTIVTLSLPTQDPSDLYLLNLYFAELYTNVTEGERVFEIALGNGLTENSFSSITSTTFDILRGKKPLSALVVTAIIHLSQYNVNAIGDNLNIAIIAAKDSKLPPLINGIELFQVIPLARNNSPPGAPDVAPTTPPTTPPSPTPPVSIPYSNDTLDNSGPSTSIVILPEGTILAPPSPSPPKAASRISASLLFSSECWLLLTATWTIMAVVHMATAL